MKKHILVILSVLICSSGLLAAYAKTAETPEVKSAIKMYKAQNYSGCYEALNTIVSQDPSNALAYYYLAMTSAQIGNRDEAMENYDKVIALSSNTQLVKYATKGKVCLENAAQCNQTEEENLSDLDKFIKRSYGTGFTAGFTEEVRSNYEKNKIENLMREINRKDEVNPVKFKDYKDFSTEAPTSEEIAAAIKVLQRAGLTGVSTGVSDLSLISGNRSYNNDDAIWNMMLNGSGSSSMNPQLIQSFLTNQMSIGF